MTAWSQSGRHRHGVGRSFRFWLMVGVASVAIPVAVAAVTPLSRGYSTDGKLALGSVVGVHPNSPDRVEPATTKNVDNLLGVVINNEGSVLSISTGEDNQAQIATNGIVQALVSDINGPIQNGDHVTASPIAGVGMKATGNVRVLGVAQGELTNGIKQTYKDQNDKDQTVTLGQAPVLVNVAYYFKEPEKTLIPSALQKLADALAGKTVSPLPIIISVAIFVIMLIVVVSIIYSMIRHGIVSVGRNPMSQSAIYRNVIQLSGLVIVILGVGLSSIYLVLTRVG
jgi:hypothetical protein